MKAVLDLTKAITDGEYYHDQFSRSGNEKNILFVAPQLTSKHLYKFILPFFSFYNENVHTAITGLEKYNPFEQIVRLNTTLNQQEILWANFIVFPFTTMDLSKQYGLYEAIREVNPNCKIVFFIDFNFYNVPSDHPHKELFDFPNIIDSTERNILYSDICLTSNIQLRNYMIKKFTELSETKYSSIDDIPVTFGAIPYLIDEEIVLQNIDFELYKPSAVINKDIFKKVSDVAEEIKKEDLSKNKLKAKRLSNKKLTPKKVAIKTTKVVANKGKTKVEVKSKGKVKSKVVNDTNIEELGNKVEPSTQEANTNTNEQEVKKELPRKYRIGIICSTNNYHDIKHYNDEFRKINSAYGDNVTLIFVGYDYDEDKANILEGVNFEYVKQVSIIHYFKQLQSLDLDLVIVPLDKNVHNVTSENFNKYLECGLFKIPIMVDDMFPYNHIILSQRNGFLFKGKENFMNELHTILSNYDLIKSVGEESRNDVIKNYTYTQKNIDVISSIYS